MRWFVLNAEANVEVDFTALKAVQELQDDLRTFGLTMGEDRVFPTLPTAITAYEQWTADHPPTSTP